MYETDLFHYDLAKQRYGEKIIEEWRISDPEREEDEFLRISKVGKKYYVIYGVVPWDYGFESDYEVFVFDSWKELEINEKIRSLRKMFQEWGERTR